MSQSISNSRVRPQRPKWPWGLAVFIIAEASQIGGVNNYKLARGLFVIAGLLMLWDANSRFVRDRQTSKQRLLGFCGMVVALTVGIWASWTYLAPQPVSVAVKSSSITSETIFSVDRSFIPAIEVGTSGVIFTKSKPGGPPDPMFETGKIIFKPASYAYASLDPILRDTNFLLESVGGELKVSTTILDDHGNVVTRLIRNEWDWGDRPVSFDRNYNSHSLEVQDRSGNIVLQVTALTDRIRLQLVAFRKNGNRAYLVQSAGRFCCATVSFNNTANEDLSTAIRPMFKYPSALHLGEVY